MASRLNEILATGTTPYPVVIQTGTGTANTAKT